MPWSDDDSRNLSRIADKVNPRSYDRGSPDPGWCGIIAAVGVFTFLAMVFHQPFGRWVLKMIPVVLDPIHDIFF